MHIEASPRWRDTAKPRAEPGFGGGRRASLKGARLIAVLVRRRR